MIILIGNANLWYSSRYELGICLFEEDMNNTVSRKTRNLTLAQLSLSQFD